MKSPAWVLIPFIAFATGSSLRAAVTIYNGSSAFISDLVDPVNFGPVPANAHGPSDISDLSQLETTFAVNGNSYSFVFREGIFDTTVGGTASHATAPATVSAIITAGSDFIYESNPVNQGGANISAWGFDTGTHIHGGSATANTVALFDFTGSPTDIHSFSMQVADFEGGNNWSNVVAAYRADGSLIGQISFDFPAPDYGNGTVEFIGFGADEPLGYIAFFVGEDGASGFGHGESIALGNFSAGTSVLGTVPEPGTAIFLGMGFFGSVCGLRRRFGRRLRN